MSSSPNPNRQRLMSPLDYLAALAGYTPPDPMPMQPMMPMPFVHPHQGPPMPFVQPPPPRPQQRPMMIPPEVVESRRRMGL